MWIRKEKQKPCQKLAAPSKTRLPPKRCGRNSSPDAPTPRGADVLCAATRDERPLKQVDDNPGISLRMVQRHLTNIYEKTDTQTRTGLTKEFMRK